MKNRLHIFILICVLFSINVFSQTTGKISGTVLDAGTGAPLIGANVMLQGTYLGAATALDGSFYIINIPPGKFTVRVSMMGYETQHLENMKVSVNRTSTIMVKLNQAVLETGEVVIVQADKVSIRKDQTSSIRNVSSDQINLMPVEDAGAVIALQAGVVGGHFRGGRIGEVSYMIDGMGVDNALDRGRAIDLDKDAIQDMEVITGTFDAEYGNAMSGVVNLVTKDGGDQIHGKVEGYFANYYTPHTETFIGLKASEIDRNQDYRFELEGPILKRRLSFYANYRYENNNNHLNGIRRYNVGDYNNFSTSPFVSEATGDSAIVPIGGNDSHKFFGKLSWRLQSLKVNLAYNWNRSVWQGYNHAFKYNPDGKLKSYGRNQMLSLQINHMFSRQAFYEFKVWYKKDRNGNYLFEDPTDERYIHDLYLANQGYCGFYTGGQEKAYGLTLTEDLNAKFDITWQADKHHSFKAGFKATQHQFDRLNSYIRNRWHGTVLEYDLYEPQLAPDSTLSADYYKKEPVEVAAYFQDKMEFDEMVVKFGFRMDYFDPKTVYPSQRRNPDNKLLFEDDPDRMSSYQPAEAKYQLSPRLGLSYQLGNAALLHFSYGHFFQTPAFYAMYENADFLVGTTDYTTEMGNGQIEPERTVQYEIGLWQELMPGMGLDVSLFYKDIYDLLTLNIYTTYNQISYGLYGNKDYGNARGLEVKYDAAFGPFAAGFNYTLQYTRGVADNPATTFSRAGESKDPISTLIPLNWDQRHTLNMQVGYNAKNYGLTLIANYGSGMPYTFTPIGENPLSQVNLYPNNSQKPGTFSVDLRTQYEIQLKWGIKTRLTLVVYNLLDRMNEYGVNPQTGRANQAIILDSQLASHRSDFNDYNDRIQNPGSFSAPRMVKLGVGFYF
ncbi:TonB-dependent receptor [candidate division KSB1 bacterium]|nr:TonB-dependent receptor [candidate division KSB1 bacterium]